MKNVDLIIKYLSGEMTRDETGSFEKDLESDPLLKAEYEDVSAAFRLIRDQLNKLDEDNFREKLMAVMDRASPGIPERSGVRRKKWYFLLPLAGSLAILLAISFMNRGASRLLTRYFDPANDPVLIAFNQASRGETDPGIILYHHGLYQEAMQEMSRLLEQDPEDQLAMLYYLLASMELDLQEDALDRVMEISENTGHLPGQSLIWYTALALVKSDRLEEASMQLLLLIKHPGPYQKDALRLQKMLLK